MESWKDIKCPICSAEMTRCHQQRTGEVFYGCSNYPGCKGARPVRNKLGARIFEPIVYEDLTVIE
jgi:ssDNA-binding Zn-finger/Zn-ribbon topoisomerase 1